MIVCREAEIGLGAGFCRLLPRLVK